MNAGWVKQDKRRVYLYASLSVAVREMDIDTGPADYSWLWMANEQAALAPVPSSQHSFRGRGNNG